MMKRDRAILADLGRFRCMTRDHIAAIHFTGLKRSITMANMVVKRLRRDGHVDVSTERRKYVYFPSPAPIRKDSAKIPHYLAIADFYVDVSAHETPQVFEVEPKLGEKGFPEPDAFMVWKGKPFFVEIQRSPISNKVMTEKLKRYERLYLSEAWKDYTWQPPTPVFPRIWIVTETRYNAIVPFKLYQTKTVNELLANRK